jgi:hypothetical protein
MDSMAFKVWCHYMRNGVFVAFTGGVKMVTLQEYFAVNNALETAYSTGTLWAVGRLVKKRQQLMLGLSKKAFMATQRGKAESRAKTHKQK